jgi:hypothetical protein
MNRYKFGELFFYVTFYSENVVNMKGLCTVHTGDNESNYKEFEIPVDFLNIIATPAP